jgi:hypothetical protein
MYAPPDATAARTMMATAIGSAGEGSLVATAPMLGEGVADGDGVTPIAGAVVVDGVAIVGATGCALAGGGATATAVARGSVLVGVGVGARVGRAVGGGVGGGVADPVTVMLPCMAAYPWMVQ